MLRHHKTQGYTSVLTNQVSPNDIDFPILRENVEAAIRSLKNEKAPGADKSWRDRDDRHSHQNLQQESVNTLDSVIYYHPYKER